MSLQKTNLNVAPFFDDFDESKNFHRVLFRPRPVQARELNQLQTILQEQINRFGKHLFKEGSMVLPGGVRTISDQDSIGVVIDGPIFDLTSFVGQIMVRSSSNNLTAKVVKIVPAEGSDPVTLFVEYQNSGADNKTQKFVVNEPLVVYFDEAGTPTTLMNASVSVVGKGVWVKSLDGVWFARGHFIHTVAQDFVISKFDNSKNMRVGFRVAEAIVDELTDSTLYSNALGYSNFQGPGASRLRLTLSLTGKAVDDDTPDSDYIELVRFEDELIQEQVQNSDYSELMKTLAQRTYEESGDYTVTPFGLDIRDHLKTGNNGVFTAEQGGDESKFVAVVKPGIGYVRGFRTENVGNQNVVIDKARGSTLANNAVVASGFGPYLLVNALFSLPNIDLTTPVSMRDNTNAIIGTCVIRSVRKESATTWRVFILNMILNAGKTIADVKNIYYTDASNLFQATLVTSTVYNTTVNDLVLRLPVDVTKSLKQGGASDTTYSIVRSFNVTTNASGVASLSLNSNEVFDTLNDNEWLIAYTGSGNAGTVIANPASLITMTGTPVGRSITINLTATHANKTIKVVAPVIKTSFIEKTKTVTQLTESISFSGQNSRPLSKADLYKIISITDPTSGENLLGYFTADPGRYPRFYQAATITTVDGKTITRNVTVVYQYFAHSVGDYFSVDSYAGLNRLEIPKIALDSGTVSLADCLDFRPLKNSAGNFDSTTIGGGEIAKPGGAVRADIEYYLPKMVSVYLDQYGRFDAVSGVSSSNPSIPEVPSGTMRLYNLSVPAYTEDVGRIVQQQIDNRRYTMRDIGKIENRVSNLEYYTSLSLLESQTNQEQIIDPTTGNNRYKNGFAVDGFTDFSLADTGNLEWMASLDITNKTLQPSFVQNVQDLSQHTLTNAQKKSEIFTLAYSEVVTTEQLLATKAVNINPYAVFTWVGALSLSPSSDYWKDVVYNNPVIINNTVDNTGGAQAGTVFNSIWNSWTDTSVTTTGNPNTGWMAQFIPFTGDTTTTTTNTTTTQATTTATTTSIAESFNSSTTDNFVGTSIIPFMRSINITFRAEKMKPFTRVYPFFDGVNVSTQCAQTGKNYNDPIITDAAGLATGIFTVPSSTEFRFRTGTSTFRLTNSPTDSRVADQMDSAAQTLFYSGGTLESRQIEVTNTRTLTANVSVATSVSTSTASASSVSVVQQIQQQQDSGGGDGGGDPIAQTFVVAEPGGAFITKVDIAFATKAAAIPVMLQIRTVTAGFPTSSVLPQGQKILPPSQVVTSADGSAMTSFVFDDPIYIPEQVEYAIVLLADTQEYTVYVAQMGQGTLTGGIAVSKQPHIGTFFQSANGRTWTENQEVDMKFRIWRAKFNNASAGQVVLKGSAPLSLPVKFNPFYVASVGTASATLEMRNHGLKAGDTFTLAGSVAGNGFTEANLTGVKTVISVADDLVTFNTGGTSTAIGYFGGGNVMVKANNAFGLFYSNFSSLALTNTSIIWEYSYKQQNNRAMTAWTRFQPNANTLIAADGVVLTGTDFLIRATIASALDNLSPVIDTSGMQTILIDARINTDLNNAQCRYISKDIRFNNPSTSSKFYISAKLPNTSGMKVYYKLITSDGTVSSAPWVEIAPTTPTLNDSQRYFEYVYQLTQATPFIGYKLKVVLTGSVRTELPSLKSIRTIALA